MIVCDGPIALLAVTGALQLSPESLVTTPGQWFEVVSGMEKIRQGLAGVSNIPDYLTLFQELQPGVVDRFLRAAADPDPVVLRVLDTAPLVGLAASIGTGYGVTPDAAFLFAAAQSLGASVLHSRYHGDRDQYANLGRELGVRVDCITEDPRQFPLRRVGDETDKDVAKPRHDRRRPTPILFAEATAGP